MENKICSKCNKPTPITEFPSRGSICKQCRKIYTLQWKSNRINLYKPDLKLRFATSVKIAKKRKKDWTITFEEYCNLIKAQCFYCGSLLGLWGIGLDRIDNLLGYSYANVVPCCGRCNIFRGQTYEFNDFCKFSNLIKDVDQDNYKKLLIKLIVDLKVIEFGDFELANVQKSNYYFDASKLVFYSSAIGIVGNSIAQLVNFSKIDVIVGPIMGAIPIISSVLSLLGNHHIQKRGAFFRKEIKTYGKEDLIEGHLFDGDRVLIVDDVATSGLSILTLADKLRENNFSVVKAITILDREQGASELLFTNSIPFKSILNISQIL